MVRNPSVVVLCCCGPTDCRLASRPRPTAGTWGRGSSRSGTPPTTPSPISTPRAPASSTSRWVRLVPSGVTRCCELHDGGGIGRPTHHHRHTWTSGCWRASAVHIEAPTLAVGACACAALLCLPGHNIPHRVCARSHLCGGAGGGEVPRAPRRRRPRCHPAHRARADPRRHRPRRNQQVRPTQPHAVCCAGRMPGSVSALQGAPYLSLSLPPSLSLQLSQPHPLRAHPPSHQRGHAVAHTVHRRL